MAPALSVLLVEDDAASREVLTLALADGGFSVTAAVNGADALRALAAGPRPRVIVLDLSMPIMDGWSFRALQRRDPHLASIPVVVISAAHAADEAVAGLAPDAFLPKPFRVGDLLGAVGRLCAASAGVSPRPRAPR